MPAPRAAKRSASKASDVTAVSKNKKKRGVVQLEVPTLPDRRGSVLVCGQGDVGQLGLGEDVMEITKFKMVPELGDTIASICAGGMHTVALDKDGVVWTFGCNDEGALGREGAEATPLKVRLPSAAVAVSAGDSHTAALLADGSLWAWGSFRDSHGSMGLVMAGREGKPCRDPVSIDIGETVVQIASGSDHLVVLTVSGSVYTMGCGEQGQLGRLSQRSASRDARQGFSALLQPGKVTLKGGASKIWAGYHATFALDFNGVKLYAWGLNNYCQLGISGEKRKTAIYTPTVCDTLRDENVIAVACGQHHSLLLAGTVLALGRTEYGRLGLGDRTEDAETPEPIPALQDKRVISIACGTSSSFAVTDDVEVVAWGMGSEGQLGTGKGADLPVPSAISLAHVTLARSHRPVRVAAGGQHSVILTEDTSKTGTKSPVPDKQTEEQTTEQKTEVEPAKKEKRPSKRQKKQEEEEEDEVTSTSTETEARVPPKVNGKDKDIAMDVDDTDNTQSEIKTTPKPEETKDTKETTTPETKTSTPETKTSTPETETSMDTETDKNTVPKIEEKPTQESVKEATTDIEMKEINGTDEKPAITEEKCAVTDEKCAVIEEKRAVTEEKYAVTEEKSSVTEEKSSVTEEKVPLTVEKVQETTIAVVTTA